MKKLNKIQLVRASQILAKPATNTILLILWHNFTYDQRDRESLPVTKLIKMAGGSVSTISMRINDLIMAGLVKSEQEHSFQGRRLISLTEKGQNVAELIDRADWIMEGNTDPWYPVAYKMPPAPDKNESTGSKIIRKLKGK